MGSSQSKKSDKQKDYDRGFRKFGEKIKSNVNHEIGKRMMVQREVQMAVNIAKARDNLQIFGSAWLTLVSGVSAAKLAGRAVPPVAGVPIVVGGLMLGNMADLAYGNKLARVTKEAEHILENERARFVPVKQAPFANFYSEEEKASFLDDATAAAMLWPSSMFSRSFVPPSKETTDNNDQKE